MIGPMRLIRASAAFVVSLLISAMSLRAETITVATYNIENFYQRFAVVAHDVGDRDVANRIRAMCDKENWVTSQVILDPKFNPDVLVLEECCDQEQLEKFNKQWLKDAYATVIVFPSNTERHQSLGLLLTTGFKILERKDQYYLEKDPGGGNERGDRLFARGPAFCLVQTPGGYKFWVGVTHQKSKSGNNLEITTWRNREAKRTHEIIKELEAAGPSDVMLLGDMNDELGIQEYEQQGGGDVIANLVGPDSDGLVLATKPLIDAGKISYGGYWRPDHRAFIDQILVTKSMKDELREVNVFTDGLARASSDHYPVYIRLETTPPATTQPAR
jgi:endonuclease/exonuclease/phosphatase family metal-dependent hydrolase